MDHKETITKTSSVRPLLDWYSDFTVSFEPETKAYRNIADKSLLFGLRFR